MSISSPISTAYQNLLSKGRLSPNHGQATLVCQLGQLQQSFTVRNERHWWWKHNHDATLTANGIYIYGGVGTGKSRIADLFAATLPVHVTRRRSHFFEFMTDMHMRLHRARSEANYAGDPLVRIGREIQAESSVLCLDEFQVSDIADAVILKRLFGSFWESGGIMVSTSNRHPKDLYKNGLNRGLFVPFIGDLQRRCAVFRMEGDHDYRMDGKKEIVRGDVFFIDSEQFQDSLSEATNDTQLEPIEIDVVMGRKLQVNAAAGTGSKAVVSMTLPALCRSSLGAADYHALSAFASTIYISGLQQFAADDLDTVRRFITLVDVAYESRTRVLCLSTEPILKTFENVILAENGDGSEALDKLRDILQQDHTLMVKGEGGSSSSMMSTFLGGVEWSATGLKEASLATGGAGETDVRFATGRAISRLAEMASAGYGT